MIPVTLALGGIAQPHTYHFAVVEHPRLTSAALLATVYQAMQDTNGYNDPSTDELRGTISIAGYPDVHIDDWFAATNQEPASLAIELPLPSASNASTAIRAKCLPSGKSRCR